MDENGSLESEYARIYVEMVEKESEVKKLKEKLTQMQEALIEKFTTQGINRISLKGGVTLRLDCKIWPKVTSVEDAVSAIKAAGLPELLAKESYQTMSLAAFLRELDRNGDPLPEQFNGVIEPNPTYKIIAARY